MAEIKTRIQGPTAEPTPRQARVLRVIEDHVGSTGMPPTVRAIGRAMGGLSVNGVMGHLAALVKKGHLEAGEPGTPHRYRPKVAEGCCPACGQKIPPSGSRPSRPTPNHNPRSTP